MKITDAKSFGEALRRRRKELGYTQSYIADFTGLSVSFLSDLENGKKTVQLEKAIRVAMLLGMDLNMEARGAR
ncbi:MAG: helix-turn-helix domain-containing protein [Bilifractor sp.]